MVDYVLGRGRLYIGGGDGPDIEVGRVQDVRVSLDDQSLEVDVLYDVDGSLWDRGPFEVSIAGTIGAASFFPYRRVEVGFDPLPPPPGRRALMSSTGLRPREAQ